MSAFTKPALLDSAKAVGLSLVLGVILAFAPLLCVAAVPLMPIPMAFITSKHGPRLGMAAALIAGAASLALTGLAAGLLILLLAVLAGVGAGLALRRRQSQFRLFVVVAAAFCLALLLWLGALLAAARMGPVAAVQQLTNQAIAPARDFYTAMGLSQQQVNSLIGYVRDFAAALPYMAPALLLVLSIALSGATVSISRRVFDRLRQPFPRDFAFRELRVHFAFAYLMILGLLCELLSPYLTGAPSSVADLVGTNLLIVSEAVFFIQGLAIASYFLNHYRLSRPKRWGVYAGLVLLQMTLSLTSWLGLFDTWIDYRRRFIRPRRQNN